MSAEKSFIMILCLEPELFKLYAKNYREKKKFAAGAASGPGGGNLGLSCLFLACWGPGMGCIGLLLGTRVFVVVASSC